ncbi:MAG: KH domain-containing protein [Alphaproteobacteria bacterium]|nr:KH domain-containing protein [Alphaproteobacteria bacterium]
MAVEDLVTFLVRGLVDDPDAVRVAKVEGDATIMLELSVASDDVELVRGEDGETLRHIKAVVAAAAGRRKAILELMDGIPDEDGEE